MYFREENKIINSLSIGAGSERGVGAVVASYRAGGVTYTNVT
jgi:hypothetical protein